MGGTSVKLNEETTGRTSWGRGGAEGIASRPARSPALEVTIQGDVLSLRLRGGWRAEKVLEFLPRVFEHPSDTGVCRIDLSHAKGFDHAALSALVLVLRRKAWRHRQFRILGLKPWACRRLFELPNCQTVWGRCLLSFKKGEVVLRCA